MMQDRAGDQMREVGDEQRVVREAVLARQTPMRIYEERNLRERKK